MSDDNIIKYIIEYIETNDNICDHFNNTYNSQKYGLDKLLPIILFVLKEGICWRSVSKLKITGTINWNTIYKMHRKLIKFGVYKGTYKNILNKFYQNKNNQKDLKTRITDTTAIINKYGVDKVKFNGAYPKHKITKISTIIDKNARIINMGIFSGNEYDSKIFIEQLKMPSLVNEAFDKNNRNIILADSAYDSNTIRNELINQNFRKLIVPQNKRNIKNKKLIKKMTKKDKEIFRKRIRVEHMFNKLKQFKRIYVRYEKDSLNYEGFIYLALIKIIIRTQ